MKASLIALTLLAMPAPAFSYTYSYSYVGAPFASTTESCTSQCFTVPGLTPITATIPSMSFDVPNPSGTWFFFPGLPPLNVPMVSGTMSAGGVQFTASYCCGTFTLTDGIVTSWALQGSFSAQGYSVSATSTPDGDSVVNHYSHWGSGNLFRSGSGPAGVWSGGPVPVIQNPIPGALPLFITGLALLGWLTCRRRIK